jgi:transcriptional regulator with XRE-family HTH domain
VFGGTLPAVRRATGNPTLYKVLGQRIAAARANHGSKPSQSQLARMVGLTRGSVANIELGTQRPPLHIVWAIAQALDADPTTLLPRPEELEEAARAVTDSAPLDPAVARVVEEMPIARAWLSATRGKVGQATDRLKKRRQV